MPFEAEEALGRAKEPWLCTSQNSRDRYVFFFDCSEGADRDIDKSDFGGQNPEVYENDFQNPIPY